MTSATQDNVRVFYQFLFHRNVIDELKQLSFSRGLISRKLDQFLDRLPARYYDPGSRVPRRIRRLTRLRYKRNIIEALHDLFSMDNSRNNKRIKLQHFEGLQKNSIFANIGLRFIISLLNKQSLEDKLFFQISWTRRVEDELKVQQFTFGKDPRTELHRIIEFMQSSLYNQTFPLRLTEYDPTVDPEYPE